MLNSDTKPQVKKMLEDASKLLKDVSELALGQDEQVEATARLHAQVLENFAEYVEAQT